jgi:hypothetical protein
MLTGPTTVEELRRYLLRAEGLSWWQGDGWRERNFPSGHPRIDQKFDWSQFGECPHTNLLVRIAEIIGVDRKMIDENASRFCGQHVKDVNDLGPWAGRQGTEYHPDRFCERLYWVLNTIANLASFAGIPAEIKEDGSLRVVLEAPTIEEMDKLYQQLRMSVTKAHFISLMPKITEAITELANIFGEEVEIVHTPWFGTIGSKGGYFFPPKGCPVAPEDEFSGILA